MSDGRIPVAAFDCYGTLVDWEGGMATFLASLCLEWGDPNPEPGDQLRRQWETIQYEIIQGPYKTYKQVLAESLAAWVAERGLPDAAADGDALVRAMRSWQPFPDTRPALLQARAAGMKLYILSNTDRDIIHETLRHINVPFEGVVTAEDCGAYKPALGNFERLLAMIDLPPDQVLHTAFGFKYDIATAQQVGMRTAWINRHVEPAPGPARPDHEWRDLWGLASFAGGPGPGID